MGRRFLPGQPKHVRVVTLNGEVFYASGQVLAGKGAKAGTLSRPRQRREFIAALENVARQMKDLEAQTIQLSGQLDIAQREASARQADLTRERSTLEKARSNERQAESRQQAARREYDWQVSQRAELTASLDQLEKDRLDSSEAIATAERAIGQVQEALRAGGAVLADLSLEDLQEMLTHWRTRAAVSTNAVRDASIRRKERDEAVTRLQSQQSGLNTRLAEMDRSYQEIADALGLPINTVKVHLLRAKEQIRKKLEGTG